MVWTAPSTLVCEVSMVWQAPAAVCGMAYRIPSVYDGMAYFSGRAKTWCCHVGGLVAM
jgi:hypothetical protein